MIDQILFYVFKKSAFFSSTGIIFSIPYFAYQISKRSEYNDRTERYKEGLALTLHDPDIHMLNGLLGGIGGLIYGIATLNDPRNNIKRENLIDRLGLKKYRRSIKGIAICGGFIATGQILKWKDERVNHDYRNRINKRSSNSGDVLSKYY